jgi:hypothetical protein
MASTTSASTTPTARTRKSRATRAAEKLAEQTTPATQPAAETTPTPAPEPKVEHKISVDLGLTETPTWRPVAVVDGTSVACPHTRYGHESEKAAKSCINRLVREASA